MVVTFGFREEDAFAFEEGHIKNFKGSVVILFLNLTIGLCFVILENLHICYTYSF